MGDSHSALVVLVPETLAPAHGQKEERARLWPRLSEFVQGGRLPRVRMDARLCGNDSSVGRSPLYLVEPKADTSENAPFGRTV